MNIKQEISHFKTLITQGSDLLLLRLRLLQLDASEQLANIIKIIAALAIAAVLLLVGLIALLFGLNTILTDEAKLWVFFGITSVCILFTIALLCYIPQLWRNGNSSINETLQALQDDLRLLHGNVEKKEMLNDERNQID